jgi:hypothetical protein
MQISLEQRVRSKLESAISEMGCPPTLIALADLHLCSGRPAAWAFDILPAQVRALRVAALLSRFADCPLLLAGDIFDEPRPRPEVITAAEEALAGAGEVVAIPGQHDLPNHSLALYRESGLRTLEAARILRVLLPGRSSFLSKDVLGIDGFGFGVELETKPEQSGAEVALVHQLAWHKAPPFPTAPKEGSAARIYKRLSPYRLILCGDNHQRFAVRFGSTWLVNLGSLLPMARPQANHVPAALMWWGKEEGVIRWFSLPLPRDPWLLPEGKEKEEIEIREAAKCSLREFLQARRESASSQDAFRAALRARLKSEQASKIVQECVWEAHGASLEREK